MVCISILRDWVVINITALWNDPSSHFGCLNFNIARKPLSKLFLITRFLSSSISLLSDAFLFTALLKPECLLLKWKFLEQKFLTLKTMFYFSPYVLIAVSSCSLEAYSFGTLSSSKQARSLLVFQVECCNLSFKLKKKKCCIGTWILMWVCPSNKLSYLLHRHSYIVWDNLYPTIFLSNMYSTSRHIWNNNCSSNVPCTVIAI